MRCDLEQIRQQKRLTMRDLAEKSEIAKSTISLIETMQSIPRLDTVCMLARALDMSPTSLFELLIAGEDF